MSCVVQLGVRNVMHLLIPKSSVIWIVDALAEYGSGEAEATIRAENKMRQSGRDVGGRIHDRCEESVTTVGKMNGGGRAV